MSYYLAAKDLARALNNVCINILHTYCLIIGTGIHAPWLISEYFLKRIIMQY